jgi:hypothetical protein
MGTMARAPDAALNAPWFANYGMRVVTSGCLSSDPCQRLTYIGGAVHRIGLDDQPHYNARMGNVMVIRQCAWCGEVLEDRGGEPGPALVSHGICGPCEDRFMGSLSLDSVHDEALSPVLLG